MKSLQVDRAVREQLVQSAEGYLDLATAFDDAWGLQGPLREGLVANALSALDKAEKRDGEAAPILYLRGCAYQAIQKYEKAVECLTLALEKDDRMVGGYLALGWCYKRLGRLDLAIDALGFGIRYQPRHPILLYNLACYLALDAQSSLAISYLQQALNHSPELADLLAKESDFDSLRDHAQFKAFVELRSA